MPILLPNSATMPIPDPSMLLLFVLGALVLAATPGPSVLYIVARGINQGRAAALVSVLGIASGDLVHITAAALGVSALLLSSALAFSVVKYLGAAYLIYLGIHKLSDRELANPTQLVKRESLKRIFLQGFVVNALNPKAALFFIAFLPQFVNPTRGAVLFQIIFLGVLFTLVASASDSVYALVSGTIGRWLKQNPRLLKTQRYVTGGTYIGLGVATAFSSPQSK
jgi:threonine/homoserine/homoserine lactone efflux protein